MVFSLMGHILTHDCLHMNNDTLLHLAIMYVNKMDKKWQYAAKEEQAGIRMNYPCVGSLQVVGDALRRRRAWIFYAFVILHRLLMSQHATAPNSCPLQLSSSPPQGECIRVFFLASSNFFLCSNGKKSGLSH